MGDSAPLNRQLRRLQRKLQRGKPAPRRESRGAAINTMSMVRNKVGRLTDAEIGYIMQPAVDGFDALRRGVARYNDWRSLAQLVTFGVSIEASGIVTGMATQFAAARAALKAVRERVTAPATPTWGTSTALRAGELQALDEVISLHRFQLEQISAGELQRLYNVIARAGNEGVTA